MTQTRRRPCQFFRRIQTTWHPSRGFRPANSRRSTPHVLEVYVRLVGQPNSKIDVSTCAVDTTGVVTGTVNAVLCSTDHFVKTRYTGKGEPSFTNATSQLLSISNPLLCGSSKPCGLFAAAYLNYFWDWNTTLGRPHAQLWF